jgi:hypothetical protein
MSDSKTVPAKAALPLVSRPPTVPGDGIALIPASGRPATAVGAFSAVCPLSVSVLYSRMNEHDPKDEKSLTIPQPAMTMLETTMSARLCRLSAVREAVPMLPINVIDIIASFRGDLDVHDGSSRTIARTFKEARARACGDGGPNPDPGRRRRHSRRRRCSSNCSRHHLCKHERTCAMPVHIGHSCDWYCSRPGTASLARSFNNPPHRPLWCRSRTMCGHCLSV